MPVIATGKARPDSFRTRTPGGREDGGQCLHGYALAWPGDDTVPRRMNRHEAAPPTDAWATEIRALGVEPNTMPIAGGRYTLGGNLPSPLETYTALRIRARVCLWR